MSWTEWLMIVLGLKLVVAVAATLWNMNRRNDRAATVCAVVAIIYLAFFAWAQTRAEGEHELKHAKHKAVQEQMESLREF